MAGPGLIYSGYSNEQIAGELEVAAPPSRRISAICTKNSASPTVSCRAARAKTAEDDGIWGVSLADNALDPAYIFISFNTHPRYPSVSARVNRTGKKRSTTAILSADDMRDGRP